jgi:hypothetical protein
MSWGGFRRKGRLMLQLGESAHWQHSTAQHIAAVIAGSTDAGAASTAVPCRAACSAASVGNMSSPEMPAHNHCIYIVCCCCGGLLAGSTWRSYCTSS